MFPDYFDLPSRAFPHIRLGISAPVRYILNKTHPRGTKRELHLSKDMGHDSDGHDDDLEAIRRCLGGDERGFEGLVMKYQKRMLNTAYRITGSYEDACEVVQDAFVAAYRGLADFRGQSGFSTWLCAITLNQARSRVQQISNRTRRETCSLDDPVSTEDPGPWREPAAKDPSALDRLEKKERDMKIQECIGRLAPDFRAVLVLRDIQGFSYAEIGSMLTLAEGTVKSRLSRAREAVKNCLKKILGGF